MTYASTGCVCHSICFHQCVDYHNQKTPCQRLVTCGGQGSGLPSYKPPTKSLWLRSHISAVPIIPLPADGVKSASGHYSTQTNKMFFRCQQKKTVFSAYLFPLTFSRIHLFLFQIVFSGIPRSIDLPREKSFSLFQTRCGFYYKC